MPGDRSIADEDLIIARQQKALALAMEEHNARVAHYKALLLQDNNALENDIARKKGLRIPHPGVTHPVEPLPRELFCREFAIADTDWLIAHTDCGSLLIKRHNRLHPEARWADVDDLMEILAGKGHKPDPRLKCPPPDPLWTQP